MLRGLGVVRLGPGDVRQELEGVLAPGRLDELPHVLVALFEVAHSLGDARTAHGRRLARMAVMGQSETPLRNGKRRQEEGRERREEERMEERGGRRAEGKRT